MKAQYTRLMDVLHRFCMIVAGFCLVLITLIIPWGVFTRYVLNSASSWPEPAAVLAMIWFSFLAAALCYRERLHIGVAVIPMMFKGAARTVIGWLIEERQDSYGALGAAAALLFSMYLIGRLVVTSAVLNATVARRSGAVGAG